MVTDKGIRKATATDASAILALVKEAHSLAYYGSIPLSMEKVKHVIALAILSPEWFCMVSEKEKNGKKVVCGVLAGTVDEISWSIHREAHDVIFYVNDLGRGSGLHLVKEFMKWAESKHVSLIGMSVSLGGGGIERVGELYTKLGMRYCGGTYLRKML